MRPEEVGGSEALIRQLHAQGQMASVNPGHYAVNISHGPQKDQDDRALLL